MNPPQTLNSDKCSNPDSSGYIDDSTIRVSIIININVSNEEQKFFKLIIQIIKIQLFLLYIYLKIYIFNVLKFFLLEAN